MNSVLSELTAVHVCLLLSCTTIAFGEPVNGDAKRLADFDKRVAGYLKLHKRAGTGLPQSKPTGSPETITNREHELAEKIRSLRPNAKRGDIFTLAISAEFRRLLKMTWRGSDAAHIRSSLASSEPVSLVLHVNGTYPTTVPLQSTPATLLQNLPVLPQELEYRVIAHNLVLRDIEANVIVDFIERAIP
jgi:hypothetical protein